MHSAQLFSACKAEKRRTRKAVTDDIRNEMRSRIKETAFKSVAFKRSYNEKCGEIPVWRKCAVFPPAALKWLVAPKRAGGFTKYFAHVHKRKSVPRVCPSTWHDFQPNRLPPPNTTLCFLEIIAIKRQTYLSKCLTSQSLQFSRYCLYQSLKCGVVSHVVHRR